MKQHVPAVAWQGVLLFGASALSLFASAAAYAFDAGHARSVAPAMRSSPAVPGSVLPAATPDILLSGVQIDNDRYYTPFDGGPGSAATIIVRRQQAASDANSPRPRPLRAGECASTSPVRIQLFAMLKNAGGSPGSGKVELAVGSAYLDLQPFANLGGHAVTQLHFKDLELTPGSYLLQGRIIAGDDRDKDAARKYFKWPFEVRCERDLTAQQFRGIGAAPAVPAGAQGIQSATPLAARPPGLPIRPSDGGAKAPATGGFGAKLRTLGNAPASAPQSSSTIMSLSNSPAGAGNSKQPTAPNALRASPAVSSPALHPVITVPALVYQGKPLPAMVQTPTLAFVGKPLPARIDVQPLQFVGKPLPQAVTTPALGYTGHRATLVKPMKVTN